MCEIATTGEGPAKLCSALKGECIVLGLSDMHINSTPKINTNVTIMWDI